MANRRLVLLNSFVLVTAILATSAAAGNGRSTPEPRRQLSAHAREAPGRVLVYHDMEGLAGQDDWKSFLFSHPEKYPDGQKLLAADLNAVIDGLFAGGASQVDVVDAHGSGDHEP